MKIPNLIKVNQRSGTNLCTRSLFVFNFVFGVFVSCFVSLQFYYLLSTCGSVRSFLQFCSCRGPKGLTLSYTLLLHCVIVCLGVLGLGNTAVLCRHFLGRTFSEFLEVLACIFTHAGDLILAFCTFALCIVEMQTKPENIPTTLGNRKVFDFLLRPRDEQTGSSL